MLPRWSLAVPLFLYLGMASIYLAVTPPLEGFDAIAHQNYINYLRQFGQLPRIDAETAAYSYELVQQPPLYYLVAAALSAPWPHAGLDEAVRARENVYFPTLSARWSVDLPHAPPGLAASLWIARLVSLLGGALAVMGAWRWMRAVLGRGMRDAPFVALAAVTLFALNPLFLFISTTITNDSWAIAGAVWVMWLAAEAARQRGASLWRWAALGIAAGLAALVKYSVLVLIAPVGLTLLLAQWLPVRVAWRTWGRGVAVALGAALGVAGFWYGRNLALYGELIPLQQAALALNGLQRGEPMAWHETLARLGWLFYSYWGVFVAIFAPAAFYEFFKWFALAGALGLLVALWRTRANREQRAEHWARVYFPALLWPGSVAIAVIIWMRTVAYGEQARLLLIAGPALALLLVLGWRALLPRRILAPGLLAITIVLAGVALWPVPTLLASYRAPPTVEPERLDASPTYQPVHARFAPGMELVGFDMPAGRALAPHDTRPLTLYWTTPAPLDQDYTLFVHMADANDTMWYQYDGAPAEGRHPTRQWRPQAVFAMTLERSRAGPGSSASVQAVAAPTAAALTVGFYPHGEPTARVPLAGEHETEDRLTLAQVRLLPGTPVQDASEDEIPVAIWENGIRLLHAEITPGDEPGHIWLDAVWETGALLIEDLTVFVHLVDQNGDLAGQVDTQPQAGAVPTSTWLAGERIEDRYVLALPSDLTASALLEDQPESYALYLGWYDVETGARVARMTSGPAADSPPDALRLPLAR
jgi:4-amino-4-deoxy-L-arabinose transferase-like glycosyltransferase